MSRTRKSNSYIESGAVFCLVGIASMVIASRYPIGAMDRVGAGFFPLVLALILTGLGAALVGLGLRGTGADEEALPVDLRSVSITIGAIVFFGFAITWLGLLLTVPLTVLIGSWVGRTVNWRQTGIVALVMTAFIILVFSLGLGLPIPVLPRVF